MKEQYPVFDNWFAGYLHYENTPITVIIVNGFLYLVVHSVKIRIIKFIILFGIYYKGYNTCLKALGVNLINAKN